MILLSFSSRNMNGKIAAGNLPLNRLNVISLIEDNQDHQLLINPPLVAHLEPFKCKQSKVSRSSMLC